MESEHNHELDMGLEGWAFNTAANPAAIGSRPFCANAPNEGSFSGISRNGSCSVTIAS